MASSKGGFSKFVAGLFGKEPPPAPKAAVNAHCQQPPFHPDALEWVLQNAALAYSGLTPEQTEAVRRVMQAFIQTPGASVGEVTRQLSRHFDPELAQIIAVTEITRVRAHAAQMEGEELKAAYPGVRVVKRWHSHGDEQTCPVCQQLAGKETPLEQPFAAGVFLPPAHPGCRCWVEANTRLR